MNNTWDIIQIIDRYNKRAATIEKYSREGEELRELYAQNLRLQCVENYGHIITVDDFIYWVEEGYVIDDDGKYNEDFVKSKFDDFIKYTKNI